MDKQDIIKLDVPLFIRLLEFAKEDAKSDMDLHKVAENIIDLSIKKSNLTMSDYGKIIKNKKIETKESMGADSAGSFEAPMGTMVKRKINTIPNFNINEEFEFIESTDSSSSGFYDAPIGGKRKDPLSIDKDYTTAIRKTKAIKDKSFPKWGGPGGIFIKIKDKCKKFPYCNQGDINAIEVLRESISEISRKYRIPKEDVEKMVIKEIKDIFIEYENK